MWLKTCFYRFSFWGLSPEEVTCKWLNREEFSQGLCWGVWTEWTQGKAPPHWRCAAGRCMPWTGSWGCLSPGTWAASPPPPLPPWHSCQCSRSDRDHVPLDKHTQRKHPQLNNPWERTKPSNATRSEPKVLLFFFCHLGKLSLKAPGFCQAH